MLVFAIEFYYCVTFLTNGNIGNTFLSEFIFKKKLEADLQSTVIKTAKKSVMQLVPLFINLVFLLLMRNLSVIDHYIAPETIVTEQTEAQNFAKTSLVHEMKQIFTIEIGFLIFISYLTLSPFYNFHHLNVSTIGLYIIGPLLYFFLNFFSYKFLKYYKPLICGSIYLIGVIIFKNDSLKETKGVANLDEYLTKDVLDTLKNEGFTYKFIRKEDSVIDIKVISKNKQAVFYLLGDLRMFLKIEIAAAMYHEIGHAIHESNRYRTIIEYINVIFLSLVEIIVMKLGSLIKRRSISKCGMYFICVNFAVMFAFPISDVFKNFLFHNEELAADLYSKSNVDSQHLAIFLCKVVLHHEIGLYFFTPYGYLTSSHPSLLERLKALGHS
ncbi:hypothetical protein NGRA_1117 [Nosema granulosis]|uniref:Peptidase M48 domain-containing protein n=1 Tax=Nosema granulosis TaxID=83296 RepID=A0A9P6KZP2_9MICR|nr:hypothetical protein NGRA_1117 [Nosema granulosis]